MCVYFIRDEYKRLTGEGVEKAIEVTRFLAGKLPAIRKDYGMNSLRVAWHDPCHSVNSLNVHAEPRAILRSMGIKVIDSESGCCGFGGTFRALYPDMSRDILKKRMAEYKKADVILTSCPNCVLQLKSGIKGRNVKHIVEVVSEAVSSRK